MALLKSRKIGRDRRMNLRNFSAKSALLESVATALADATRPTERADLVGAAYAGRVGADHRRDIGLYLTPSAVADFMADQIARNSETVRVLDPAAGAGILLCAAVEALVRRPSAPRHIELVAYEVDRALVGVLTAVLDDLRDWAAARGTDIAVNVIQADFILEHAPALRSMGGFLPHLQPGDDFEVVICNPPYLALAGLPLDRHRADPIRAQQHDPSPQHMLLRAVPRPDHGLQPFPVARTKPDLDAFSHPAKLAYSQAHWNHSSASIH